LFSIVPGLINGLLIAKLKVPSFIATIGMMSIAQGLAFLANDGTPVTGLPRLISDIGNTDLLYYIPGEGFTMIRPEGFGAMRDLVKIIPIPVVFSFALLGLCYFILQKSIFGRYIYSIGSNFNSAIFAGLPVNKVLIKVYVLASVLYGMAGMIYIFRFGNAQPNMGAPMLLFAIGSVFIGGAGMSGGTGTLTGTIIGALLVATIQAGLSTLAVSAFWQYVAIGLVIIFAVLFDRFKLKLIS
jgi:ribose transport system permease protein